MEITITPPGGAPTQVTVDDSFRNLSPEAQGETVDEIATHIVGNTPSKMESGMRGVASGVLLGANDELNAAAQASPLPMAEGRRNFKPIVANPVDALAGAARMGYEKLFPPKTNIRDVITGSQPESGASIYDAALPQERGRNAAAEEENPATFIGGQLAGGLALPMPGIKSVGGLVKAGGVLGGVQGFNNGEGGIEDRLIGGAIGAGAGAVGGGILGGIGAGIGRAVGPKAVPPVVEAGDRLGISVPRAVATDSRPLQAAAQSSRELPVIGGMMERAGDKFLADTEGAVTRTVDSISPNAASKADAGASTRAAVAKAVDTGFDDSGKIYKSVGKVAELDNGVDVSGALQPTIDKIRAARAASGKTGAALDAGIGDIVELASKPATFNGLQRARTEMSKSIAFDKQNGGFLQGDLKQLRGALTGAMETAVKGSAKPGQEQAAFKLWKAADARHAEASQLGKELRGILATKSDERLADRVIGMASSKGGADLKQLAILKREMGDAQFSELVASSLSNIGNRQGKFSGDVFHTAISNLSPGGKDAMFGASGQLRQAIDDLQMVTGKFKEVQQKFASKSQSGRVGVGVLSAGGAMASPVTALAAAVGAAIGTKWLANPATAKAAANWAKAYAKAATAGSATAKATLRVAAQQMGSAFGKAFGTSAQDAVRGLGGLVPAHADEDKP